MNKIPNGNWEDDKEIYHQALQDGYNILEILKAVYEYGRMDGFQEANNWIVDILNGIDDD